MIPNAVLDIELKKKQPLAINQLVDWQKTNWFVFFPSDSFQDVNICCFSEFPLSQTDWFRESGLLVEQNRQHLEVNLGMDSLFSGISREN